MPSDQSIVRQVLRGRRNRFGLLVERYLPKVYAVAYAGTQNHADAEDVSQDTFMKALESLDTLRETNKFEGWVMTIARNTARKLHRKRNREGEILSTFAKEPGTEIPDVSKDELVVLLRNRIAQLGEADREVLLLYHFSENSLREIATVLDVSPAAAAKRVQRARERLSRDLLQHLDSALKPRHPLKNQAKKITALALAASVSWKASTATAAMNTGISFWLPTTMKGSSAWIGVAAVLVATTWALVEGQEEITDESSSSSLVPIVEPVQMTESSPELAISEPLQKTVTTERTNASPAPNEAVATEEDYDIERILDQKVSIVFENILLSKILDFVSSTYDLEIILDDRPTKTHTDSEFEEGSDEAFKESERTSQAYVTDGMIEYIDARDVPLGEALAAVTDALGLLAVEEPGLLWISTPELIQKEVPPESDERFDLYDHERKLDLPATLVFKNVHISSLLDFIADGYDFTTALDYRVVEPDPEWNHPDWPLPQEGETTNGMIHSIVLKDLEIRDLLKIVLRPLNLAYALEPGFIWITTPSRLEAQGHSEEGARYWAESGLLEQRASFVFEAIHLTDLFTFVHDTYKINVAFDFREIMPKHKPESIRGDAPRIPLIFVHDLELRQAFEIMLRPLDLAYEIIEDRIFISTPERLAAGDLPDL